MSETTKSFIKHIVIWAAIITAVTYFGQFTFWFWLGMMAVAVFVFLIMFDGNIEEESADAVKDYVDVLAKKW